MAYIAIPIPQLPGKQDIEIDVTINGEKQQMHYRVELLRWADCPGHDNDRVQCIQHLLQQYDQDWSLFYIGAPTEQFVPITFVKKEDLKRQHKLVRGES